jgi:arylsulfatase A-like enzyme
MDRRQFLAGTLAAASLSGASKKPNIVYIMLDDEGTFDFGCYGQKKIQTPNADRLAAEGMKFNNAYSGAAVCAPARAVLMTGLHGGHAPVRANAGTIPITAGDVTIASVLKKAGYATGGFGKWGLGDAGTAGVPWQHGFDEFVGYLHQVHAHFYYPEFLWDNDRKLELPGNKNGAHGQYSADLIAERGLEFVRKHKDGPFFLYATGTLPHGNYEVPDLGPYADKNWPEKYKIYAAMCTRADTHIGRLLALLKELKLEDNTVVILTSDNGAPGGEDHGYDFFRSNGDLRGTKGTVYEGGIRVPFLVRWPGRVKPGSVSQYPIAFCDIMPTLAEIADARPPSGIDGLSIVPELTGGKQPKREFLYWEHNVYDQKTQKLREDRLLQAVRHGEWKGVRTKPGAPLELYNLRSDPSEQNNVAAEHPDVVATIEAYLKTARTTPRPHNTGSMKWVS